MIISAYFTLRRQSSVCDANHVQVFTAWSFGEKYFSMGYNLLREKLVYLTEITIT
jgi:hypothetical protein